MAILRVLVGVLLMVGCVGMAAQGSGRPGAELVGVMGDGRADDGAALERGCGVGRDVWLGEGKKVLVGHGVRLGCRLHFTDGAKLMVGLGVKVELMGSVEAAAVPIFAVSGTGSVVFGVSTGSVPVEWFGAVGDGVQATGAGTDDTAAIQRAIDSIGVQGTVQLQCRTYVISGSLRIRMSNVNLYGGECEGLDGVQSMLLQTKPSIDTLTLHSDTGLIQWNRLRNLALMRSVVPSGRAKGLVVDNVGGYDVDHVVSHDSVVDFYFHAAPSYAVGSSRFLNAGWGYGVVRGYAAGAELVGYDIDSEDGRTEDTLILSVAAAGGINLPAGVISTGFLVHGRAINDVDVDWAGTAGTTYGVVIRYTGTGGGFSGDDVVFTNGTFDNFTEAGILVEGVPESALGAINFNGGYVLQFTNGAAGKCAVNVRNSSGVTVTGMQIGNTAGSGVCVTGGAFTKVTGNTIHATRDAGVSAMGMEHSVIAENTVEGGGSVGLRFDAASVGNEVVGNAIDPAKGMAVVDLSGSGYNGGGRVGGALPVGVAEDAAVKAVVSAGVAGSSEGWATATDRAFTVSFTAGPVTTVAAKAHLVRVRFGKIWVDGQGRPELPYCTFSARSAAAGAVGLFLSAGAGDLSLDAVGPVRLVAGEVYGWTVRCEGDGER